MINYNAAMAGIPALRDLSGAWYAVMGIDQRRDGPQILDTLSSYGRAPAEESWVYRCVNLKAQFDQGVPLRVYVKDGHELTPAEDSNNAAAQDLQNLLDDVNPVNMNGSDLKAFTSASMSCWGENYVRKVRGKIYGIKELWWLRAPDISLNRGATWIDSFNYRPTNGQGAGGVVGQTITTRDMIQWKTINLQDPMRGLSPLSSVRYAISINRQTDEAAANLLANQNVPPGYWQVPKDTDFGPQDRSLLRRALSALRGPKGQGKVPIIPQGLEFKQISLNSIDLESIHRGKLSRMQVCGALGVPLVLAGDDEKTTVYANMRDAERIFARYQISGLDWIADGYNGWLVPDFDPSPPHLRKIVVAFDYSQIESLQAPVEDRKKVALQEIAYRSRTPDEYRAEFRIGPPLPNGAGADVITLNTLLPADAVLPSASVSPADQPDITAEPQGDTNPSDDGSDTIRAFGRHLYGHPAVKAWQADRTKPLDVQALLGRPIPDATRTAIEAGLRRKATAASIAESIEVTA